MISTKVPLRETLRAVIMKYVRFDKDANEKQEVGCWMQKIDPTVQRETTFIAGVVLIASAIMEVVFLLLGAWDWTVLWGNLLGAAAAVLNFFLMGLTIQRALGKGEEDARKQMKASQSLRLLMLLLVAVLGATVDCFHLVAVLVPMLFPRIGVSIRALQNKE